MGLDYDLGDKSEKLRRMNHFAENARYFEYNEHILTLKIGDNLI